ncbi:MAG TPA: hypothetical protein VHX59_24340 [Mycobacteriales bacterium]|jgi:lysylphosphatidylglycerol synthetase-like protein (DUF2156 family)|nr:hypothetical protein [Mycobacteriales bacterium]
MNTFARTGIRLAMSTLMMGIVVLFGSTVPAVAADLTTAPVTGHGPALTVAAAVAALLGSAIVLSVVRVVYRIIAIALRAIMALAALRLVLGLSTVLAIILMMQTMTHH